MITLPEHDECQAAVQRFAQRVIRSELVPPDMEDVVIIPLKTGNNLSAIVALCIYETLEASKAGAEPSPGRSTGPGRTIL